MYSFPEILFFIATLSLAYIVRGITGFGSALIAVPLLAFVLPLTLVVPLIVLLDYLASLSHGLHHRRNIQWRHLFPMLPFTLAGIIAALYLFKTLDVSLIKQTLGAFVILYALYSLLVKTPHQHPTHWWAVPLGFFAGLIGTLFGTGGPFSVIYLQLQGLGKTAFRATIATIFFIDGGMRLVGYAGSGFFQRETLYLAVAGLPVMAIALYIGGHIHTSLKPVVFQRAIGILLLGSGTGLLLN